MRTEPELVERLEAHEDSLERWKSPTGEMLRRAPELEDQVVIIARHDAVAENLRWAIGLKAASAEVFIRARLDDYREELAGAPAIAEDMAPEHQRSLRLIRERLAAVIYALQWVLQTEHAWPFLHRFQEWRDKKLCAMCGLARDDARAMHVHEEETTQ